jgi:hypothetical protein
MGLMKDFYLTAQAIEEYYDDLRGDDDVIKLQLFPEVLKAAEAVLATPSHLPAPYSMDLVLYALKGAASELQELRKFWAVHRIR